MNLKILHGRFVRDPEYTRKDEESKSFAKWTIATDRRHGDGTDFHDCIMFGKRAAVVDKWFGKGSEMLCWGEERHEPYTGKDGVNRKSVTLFVTDFEFCGSKVEGKKADGDNWKKQEEDMPF